MNGTATTATGIEIGAFVRLGDLSGTPLPKLMRYSIQKVVALRWRDGIQEVRIEREHRRKVVHCWIPLSLIACTLTPEQAYPASACATFAPHRPGSGEEAYRRQYCVFCQQKAPCRYFQINHATSASELSMVNELKTVEATPVSFRDGEEN